MALACVARRRKGRRKRNWDDVYVRDLDGTLRKPNALERRLVRRQLARPSNTIRTVRFQ